MKKIVTRITIALFIITLLFADNKERKIGLVLSGGGIKGFGHLGTLYLIDSLNVPIDYVVGSSIGAISAALYATGHSPEEIDQIGKNSDWDRIFGQSPGRDKLYYFQKLDAGRFNITFGLDGFKPTSPISLSNGQYAYEHLLKLFNSYSHVNNYDDLLIPFRCNGTDIINGEEIIFNNGSIAKALRISTSIPTVFTPIEDKNRLLVDGGLINNLPSNIAEDMGANFIISSSVLSSEKSKEQIVDVFNIIGTIIDLYGYENKQSNILKSDILINPKLNNISVIGTNPKTIERITKAGKKEAYQHIDEFLKLKNTNLKQPYIKLSAIKNNKFKLKSIELSPDLKNDILIKKLFTDNSIITKDDFALKILEVRRNQQYNNLSYKFKQVDDNTFIAKIEGTKNNPIIINKIKIEGNNKIPDKDIIRLFNIQENKQININMFNEEIHQAYNTGYFEYLHYELLPVDATYSDLIINCKETKNKKIKLGIIWDNHYKLLGKVKLDIFNKPLRRLRIQNELTFSGFKQNKFNLYYLTMSNRKINIIPFLEQINQIKTFGISDYISNMDPDTHDITTNTINDVKHDLDNFSYGVIFSMMQYGSITFKSNQSKNKFNSDVYDVNYSQMILDIDQIDDLLNPRSGYLMIADYQKSNDHEKTFNYLNIKSEYFKTFHHNHTIRLFGMYKDASEDIPINLTSTYGGYNWAIGYDEFELTSYELSLLGFEYQFHYKNSTTLRFIINHIGKYNNLLFDGPEIKDPINYGFGIKIRSLLGPINFTWGRGYDTIMNEKSKRTNIFYFNFGVHL